jgi:protein ImuB
LFAARGFAGVTVIPKGAEAKVLGPLPLEALTESEDLLDIFDRWGIRTFHDFAVLPQVGVAERLGPEGVHLQKLARAEGRRALRTCDPPTSFDERIEVEYPLVLLEPLSFLLGRILGDICARLGSHGLSTTELRLTLSLEGGGTHERTYRLPVPMRDARAFLKLMQLDLEAHTPGAPVTAVQVAAAPADPRAVQSGLFLPPAPEPQKLELVAARIAAIVGEGNIGVPEIADTHRPHAFRLVSHHALSTAPLRPRLSNSDPRTSAGLALRMFRPPVPAAPIRGHIARISGPWRTSGDWWTTDLWNRDEYDIALQDGTLYRVYRDRTSGEWFIEGSYD